MSNSEPNGPSDNSDWDDRGELAWNEFDWERYLRDQDEVIHRYIAHYELHRTHADRIDEVAHLMGWDEESWSTDNGDALTRDTAAADSPVEAATSESPDDKDEPYTLHKNPIFIATKAIYLTLKRAWEPIAADSANVPQPTAVSVQTSLHRGEEQAMLAIQALDFGDYAMAISLFKRALRELNQTFSLLNVTTPVDPSLRGLARFHDDAMPRLFDLREIWLRVMNECREELERPVEDEDDE
jgi:hypothetical protein